MSLADDDEDDETGDLFKEPEDFYAPEKPPTFTTFALKDGTILSLRLVGHNPLWGHLLWNAGQVVARYIEDNAEAFIKGKTVLELGAGAGLPSLVCAHYGASQVVVTDYPDPDLIANLDANASNAPNNGGNIAVEGFLWGSDVSKLKEHLPNGSSGFDTLILADILFNHSEHEKLISTLKSTLSPTHFSRALVFFTPYRPWLLEKDLRFFELAKRDGLLVTKLFEHTMDKVMFPDDPGDEQLRRTVFAYQVTWPANTWT